MRYKSHPIIATWIVRELEESQIDKVLHKPGHGYMLAP